MQSSSICGRIFCQEMWAALSRHGRMEREKLAASYICWDSVSTLWIAVRRVREAWALMGSRGAQPQIIIGAACGGGVFPEVP